MLRATGLSYLWGSHSVTAGVALCALAAAPLSGQAPALFHTEARLIVVQVTVFSRGEGVTNLDRSAFTVYENGKPQPIALFYGDDVPVSVGIVIDNSGSMRARRSNVEAAALTFARASNPLDELFVVNFADKPRIDVPFTSDVYVLEAGIARVDSIGSTALRDAVSMAVTYLNERAARDRKALLLISDGIDNASSIAADRIRHQAEQSGIAVYAIGLPHGDPSKASRGRRELDELTAPTGGLALHLASLEEIDRAAVGLARQIRQQYTLGYTPLNQSLDGSYRKIRVDVKGPKKATVRTRAGYYATPLRSVISKRR